MKDIFFINNKTIPDEISKYNIQQMEPFHIFCFEKRFEISRTFPKLASSKITSLLGTLWRSLSNSEKQSYIDVASKLKKKYNYFDYEKKKDSKTVFFIPKLQIINRNGSWDSLTELSAKLIQDTLINNETF